MEEEKVNQKEEDIRYHLEVNLQKEKQQVINV
jgi:hypothetical protein